MKSFTIAHRITIVFSFALILFVCSSAFAGDPIPGVGIGAGKNPGGTLVKNETDSNGKFAFPPCDSGSYTITFSNTPKTGFNILFDRGIKVTVNGKEWGNYRTLPVRPGDKKVIIVLTHGNSTTISGTVTKIGDTLKR